MHVESIRTLHLLQKRVYKVIFLYKNVRRIGLDHCLSCRIPCNTLSIQILHSYHTVVS